MWKARSSLLLASLLLLSLAAPASAHHNMEGSSDIVFDQPQGTLFDTYLNISGTSSTPLRQTPWSVVNISGATPMTVFSGPHLTSVVPVDEGVYEWTLSVKVGELACTCFVHIDADGSEHGGLHAMLVVYVGDSHHRPVLLDELNVMGVETFGGVEPLRLKDSLDLKVPMVLPTSTPQESQFFVDVCEAPYGVCLSESYRVQINHLNLSGEDHLELNATVMSLEEGIWRLDVSMVDALLTPSGSFRIYVVHDLTPPEVSLAMKRLVLEGEVFHVHATIDDGYEGASFDLSWTIVGEDGSRRVPSPDEQVQDRQLTLNMNASGTYSVELTVQDSSRNTVFVRENFTVENIRPLAAISVNGLTLEDEQTLILESKNDWILNGNQSLDNEPVDYLWVIDDTHSIRGTPVLGPSDFPSTGLHTVELIVFDDDGATHSTVVQVDIQGEDSVVEQTNIVGATIVCLMLLVLLGFLWSRKGESSSTSLPKWSKADTVKHDETYRFDSGINATVEEEKPRG